MRTLPPFLKILPLIIVGILLGEAFQPSGWSVAIGATLCTLLALWLAKRKEGTLYIAAAIVLWALLTTTMRTPWSVPTPTVPEELPATITSYPTTSGRWQRCEGEIVTQGRRRDIIIQADTSIYITIGQQGTLYGYLNPLPEGSYGELMSRRGFVGQVWLTSRGDWLPEEEQITSIRIAGRKAQRALVERIERLGLDSDAEGVVEAMLTGWRGGLTPALRESYSLAGSSHLLAISGLHIGLVAMLVWWLCWLLPALSRRGHIVRNITAALIMILYAYLTGLSPSALRATLMFCTAQLALAYGTPKSALNLLTGAATVMLLANPNNLFDISFLLSFAAVVGIAIGFAPLMELFGASRGPRWLRGLCGVVVVGLCSTIATLPLVSHTFGVVSLVGIFLNPLVILTAEIIVLLGFIWVTLPLDILHPVMSGLIGGAAELQNRLVEGAARLPWAAWQMEMPTWMVALCYTLMAVGLTVSLLWKEKRVWKPGK